MSFPHTRKAFWYFMAMIADARMLKWQKRRDRLLQRSIDVRFTCIALGLLCLLSVPAEAHRKHTQSGRDCAPLHANLQDGLRQAGAFGRVVITSICTGKHVRGSYHYRGGSRSLAVDFRIIGNWRAAARHLVGWPGGFAHYCRGRGCGLFHLDMGAKRRW